MKKVMCTVYDVKAKVHGKLLPFTTTAEAIRAFGDAVRNPDTAINKHPEDFTLYHVGNYDEEKATYEMVEPYYPLMAAISCVEAQDV